MFGIDPRDIADETCGANPVYGYNWDIGTLPSGGTGTIHVRLKIPDNAPAGTMFQNEAFLQMDGENQNPDGNQQSFHFIVNVTTTTQHNVGGGGGSSAGIHTDVDAGICSLRDCSDSYYDATCGVCPTNATGNQEEKGAVNPISLLPDAHTISLYMQHSA